MQDNDIPSKKILFKYGGNAMTDTENKNKIIQEICELHKEGFKLIIVHGGGPFIEQTLELVGVESQFIQGQRYTSKESIKYIEMALKGEVGGELISLFNKYGIKAVSLSGKDGKLVKVKKRIAFDFNNDPIDLGQVGEIVKVNTELIDLLLENDFIPVITCLGNDEDGNVYNINGDNMAGALAAALKVDHFVLLTDIDGIRKDKDDPNTLIPLIHLEEIENLKENVIKGGMIPKTEAAAEAIDKGVGSAWIINGKNPELIKEIKENKFSIGTQIIK